MARILFLVRNQNSIYFKLRPIYTAFFHSIKLSGYRMAIETDRDPLAVERNTYLIKILNAYIDYDLDTLPRNYSNNFKF